MPPRFTVAGFADWGRRRPRKEDAFLTARALAAKANEQGWLDNRTVVLVSLERSGRGNSYTGWVIFSSTLSIGTSRRSKVKTRSTRAAR